MILVLSGTKDGREIIKKLHIKKYPIIVTTATDYGKSLIDIKEGLKVYNKRLDYEEMIKFIKNKSIKLVIDATHPYAEEVSKNIVKACRDSGGIPYFRFQRKESDFKRYLDIIEWADNYKSAAKRIASREGNILLTIGSKKLELFTKYIDVKRLFPRVLPLSSILKKCEDLGFRPSNIIAMQGPFSKKMNIQIIKKYNIDIVVTKDSGDIGGAVEKLEAVKECGIEVVVIKRPDIYEGKVYDNINYLLDKVSETYE